MVIQRALASSRSRLQTTLRTPFRTSTATTGRAAFSRSAKIVTQDRVLALAVAADLEEATAVEADLAADMVAVVDLVVVVEDSEVAMEVAEAGLEAVTVVATLAVVATSVLLLVLALQPQSSRQTPSPTACSQEASQTPSSTSRT